MNYEHYMQSDNWQAKRRLRLDADGHRCATCRRPRELEIHHLTYDRLGCERIEDLVTLCTRCHGELHYQQARILPTEKMLLQASSVTEIEWLAALYELRPELKENPK